MESDNLDGCQRNLLENRRSENDFDGGDFWKWAVELRRATEHNPYLGQKN
jgi:hypothetical protein